MIFEEDGRPLNACFDGNFVKMEYDGHVFVLAGDEYTRAAGRQQTFERMQRQGLVFLVDPDTARNEENKYRQFVMNEDRTISPKFQTDKVIGVIYKPSIE